MKASLPFHLQLTATGIGATIGPPQPNDLVVSNQIVTGTGRVVGQNGEIGPNGNLGVTYLKGNGTAVFTGVGRCPNRIPVSAGPHWHTVPATQAALQRCIDSFHLRQRGHLPAAQPLLAAAVVRGGDLRRPRRCPRRRLCLVGAPALAVAAVETFSRAFPV